MKINKGDIVHLKWTALNGPEGKQILQDKHPFIVLRSNDDEIVACVISSVDKVSKYFPYNVGIFGLITNGFLNFIPLGLQTL